MTFKTTGFFFVLLVSVTVVLVAQENEKQILGRYQAAASKGEWPTKVKPHIRNAARHVFERVG